MDFVVNLEYKPCVPLYRRLSDALRKAILEGRLMPGQPMPSVRDLAGSLHISRATVLRSLDDLKSQGYLETSRGQCASVRPKLPGDLSDMIAGRRKSVRQAPRRTEIEYSRFGRRLFEKLEGCPPWEVHLPEINYGGPPLSLAPLQQWKQLLIKHCRLRDLSPASDSLESLGCRPLREAVSSYLNRSRAIKCRSDQVAIVSSKQLRIDLVAHLLLDPGDLVAFEEPGYSETRQTLACQGAEIIPVPVDNDGLDVEYLCSLKEKLKAVYITPSHQDPTGAVLSLDRRYQLLAWARKTGTFIIEDDYDNEYRYGQKSLPSLQGLDGGHCVTFLSSPWKIFSHILRLGYIVFPQSLQSAFVPAKAELERHLPLIEQLAFADFLDEGHMEAHISKTQTIYARRRQSLVDALDRHMKSVVRIAPESAGMHIIVWIESELADEDILRQAAQAQIPMISTKPYYMGRPSKGEFMIAFAHIEESEIESCVANWASMFRYARES